MDLKAEIPICEEWEEKLQKEIIQAVKQQIRNLHIEVRIAIKQDKY